MFLVEGRDVSSAGYFQESVGNSLIVKLHEKNNERRPAAVAACLGNARRPLTEAAARAPGARCRGPSGRHVLSPSDQKLKQHL